MNSPAVQQPLKGEVVQPDYVSQPHSYAARDFFNTLRDLMHRVTYHDESQREAALSTVDQYEKHVIGASDLRQLVSETDRAPVEDVSKRVPASGNLPQTAPAQNIDYARLAAAIVAAQQAQSQQQTAETTVVHEITDVPASSPAAPSPQEGETPRYDPPAVQQS